MFNNTDDKDSVVYVCTPCMSWLALFRLKLFILFHKDFRIAFDMKNVIHIKEDFFKDHAENIKIDKIVHGGYEDYYFVIYFKIYGNVHAIQIPNRQAISCSNVSWAHFGKFVFCSCPSDNYTKVLFEDWSEKGLANKIKEYLENEYGTSTIKV